MKAGMIIQAIQSRQALESGCDHNDVLSEDEQPSRQMTNKGSSSLIARVE